MKRRISILLALVLVFTLLPIQAGAAEYTGSCGSNVNWYLNTDTGVLTLSGAGATKDFDAFRAPWYDYRSQIRSIVIEPGITEIGNHLFMSCGNLTSVSIPDGVTRIGVWAFYEASNLQDLVLPDSVVSIEEAAFINCRSIERLSIPASVRTIGKSAFSGNSSLTTLVIADGVQTIEYGAFQDCAKLTSVILPDSVTSIGEWGFSGDTDLVNAKLSANLTELPHALFWDCNQLKRVAIPAGVTKIGAWAFYKCKSVTDLVLPEGLQTIEEFAFCGTSLTQIKIPASVTNIGREAFSISTLKKIALLNPTCEFIDYYDDMLGTLGVTTIYGYEDSTAHAYAQKIGFAFQAITENNLWEDHNNEPVTVLNPFIDVQDDTYYYDPVLWAVETGVTSGMTPTTFEPERDCTRGQVVTFLWRAMGKPEPKNSSNPFTDVKEGAYYYDAVLWAVENGITNGMDATHFDPERTVTRAQFVTFLWRAEKQPAVGDSNPFADIQSGLWYTNAVLWAFANGVTTGTDSTHFSPENACTRGQVVTFLYRDLT